MRARKWILALTVALALAVPSGALAAPDGQVIVGPVAPVPAADSSPAPAPPVAAPAAVAPVAPAATSDKQSWWQVLLTELINLIVVIFVPVLSTLAVTLLRRWKINVEFEQVNNIASKAAGWAEQKARARFRDGKGTTQGAAKMQLALGFANELADKYKLPAKATEKLQDLIESSLGQEKVKALTKEKVKASVAAATPAPTA